MNMVDVQEQSKQRSSVDRRKKITGRRRWTKGGAGTGGGSPMDTNGVGAAG
jgi:casein kinase II subunit beta